MNEFLTDAIILDTEDSGDLDRIIYMYTSDLGKVKARAKSIRKITSKLAGHLEPLSLTKVRLVEKNGFQVVDAILIRQLPKSAEAISLTQFIKEMTFEGNQDKKLWLAVKKSFEDIKAKKFSFKPLLEILGFGPGFATCAICKDKKVSCFSFKDHVFFCAKCAVKIPKNEVILI